MRSSSIAPKSQSNRRKIAPKVAGSLHIRFELALEIAKFIPISTSTTSHRLSFYPRTIVQWNSLPPDVFTLSADPAQFRINVSKITHQLV